MSVISMTVDSVLPIVAYGGYSCANSFSYQQTKLTAMNDSNTQESQAESENGNLVAIILFQAFLLTAHYLANSRSV